MQRAIFTGVTLILEVAFVALSRFASKRFGESRRVPGEHVGPVWVPAGCRFVFRKRAYPYSRVLTIHARLDAAGVCCDCGRRPAGPLRGARYRIQVRRWLDIG